MYDWSILFLNTPYPFPKPKLQAKIKKVLKLKYYNDGGDF